MRQPTQAKGEILAYVWSLYHIGQGQWDSTSYHSHTMAPFLTLYDYARDPEVRMAAKLAGSHGCFNDVKHHRLTEPQQTRAGQTSVQGKGP